MAENIDEDLVRFRSLKNNFREQKISVVPILPLIRTPLDLPDDDVREIVELDHNNPSGAVEKLCELLDKLWKPTWTIHWLRNAMENDSCRYYILRKQLIGDDVPCFEREISFLKELHKDSKINAMSIHHYIPKLLNILYVDEYLNTVDRDIIVNSNTSLHEWFEFLQRLPWRKEDWFEKFQATIRLDDIPPLISQRLDIIIEEYKAKNEDIPSVSSAQSFRLQTSAPASAQNDSGNPRITETLDSSLEVLQITSEDEYKKYVSYPHGKKIIGCGSFGEIRRCKFNDIEAAEKKINLGDKANIKKKLEHANSLWKSLNCPNIVKLFCVFTEIYGTGNPMYGVAHMVMEYLKFGSLCNLFKPYLDTGFPEKLLYKLMHDIATAFEYIHSQNPPIIHRDVKSDNILIQKNGDEFIAKLSDFDFLRSVHESENVISSGGVLAFSAPELHDLSNATDPDVDFVKTDIYALSFIFWEMCQCSRVVENNSQIAFYQACINSCRPYKPRYCSHKMWKIIQACWDQNPRNRISAATLKDLFSCQLQQLERDQPIVIRWPLSQGNYLTKNTLCLGSEFKPVLNHISKGISEGGASITIISDKTENFLENGAKIVSFDSLRKTIESAKKERSNVREKKTSELKELLKDIEIVVTDVCDKMTDLVCQGNSHPGLFMEKLTKYFPETKVVGFSSKFNSKKDLMNLCKTVKADQIVLTDYSLDDQSEAIMEEVSLMTRNEYKFERDWTTSSITTKELQKKMQRPF